MAAIKLRISAVELDNVMTVFDRIMVFRSTTGETGVFTEITSAPTRIVLVAGITLYEYIDTAGSPTYWYEYAFYNSITALQGSSSPPTQPQSAQGYYCSISDMRGEGFALASYSDARVLTAIERASRAVERWTGRWFEPRPFVFRLDGTGQAVLRFDVPIVYINSVLVDDLEVPSTDYVVYNRHITTGMTLPDDRDDPRIEATFGLLRGQLTAPLVFVPGRQNVVVDGVWGYTDYDGSANGKTPDDINLVTIMLASKELPLISDDEGRSEASQSWRVTEYRTRDQDVKLARPSVTTTGPASIGPLSGDPTIDNILRRYKRPAMLRAI
jgi:hypothetical protein